MPPERMAVVVGEWRAVVSGKVRGSLVVPPYSERKIGMGVLRYNSACDGRG
jgi:hypothetical protein